MRAGYTLLRALLVVFGLALATAGSASAATCDTSWKAAADGSYSDPGNWTAGVPSGNNGCITLSGTYTVHAQGSPPAAALTIGGTSGTQTVSVESTCAANAVLTDDFTIGSHGAVILTDADSCAGSATLGGFGGYNAGTITSAVGSGGERVIEGSISSRASMGGTIVVHQTLSCPRSNCLLDNRGTVKIDNGMSLNVGGEFDNEGSIVASGTGNVFVSQEGLFDEAGGTATGTKPVIVDDAHLEYIGNGKSLIAVRGTSSLDFGGPFSGQTLQIESTCAENAVLSSGQGRAFTNSGTITLTNGDACGNNVTLTVGSGTLTNRGTLDVVAAHGGSRVLTGALVQKSGGAKYQASVNPTGVLNVSGAVTLTGTLVTKPHPNTGTVGQAFQVLEAPSITGTFASESGGNINSTGLHYRPTYASSPNCAGFGACVGVVTEQATLSVSPTRIAPGATLSATGTNWPANDTLTITFTDAGKVKTTYPAVAGDGSGNFSDPLVIPSTAAPGNGHVTVTSKLTGAVFTKTVTVT